MAEGTLGPEGATPGGEGQTGFAIVESQPPVQPSGEQNPQKPWHISRDYDPKRAGEYLKSERDGFTVFTDPTTGKEVARIRQIAGAETAVLPEPTSGPEWKVSPERGRWLVEEITYMETELSYEVRWNAENGPRLYELSRGLKAFVEREQKDRYLQDPLNLEKEHQVTKQPDKPLIEAIKEAYAERIARGVELAKKTDGPGPEDFTEIETRGENLETLTAKYLNLRLPITEREQVEKDLLIYFKEAHRKGLFKEVDEVYNAIFLGFKNKTYSKKQALALLAQREPEARQALEDALLGKAKDPQVNPRLLDIETAYIVWTRGKLRKIINGENPGPYKEGEWRIPGEEEEGERTETYWEPYGGYPDYYTISAKTPAQFRIAKETFLQMLKNRALGYDPNELMQNLLNFKKVLSARGNELVLEQEGMDDVPDKMTAGFMKELRQEFEGRAFLWHTFYNSEHYNKEGAKQGAMAMAMHEGPERWTRALRSGEEGGVGFHTWNLDNLAMVEFALNAQGSRGQFGDSTQVHEYIRRITYERLKERGIGIVLKDYDWRDAEIDSDPKLRLDRATFLEQLDEHLKRNDDDLESLTEEDRKYYLQAKLHTRTNQERIGIHQSAEAFKALYEGFDNGDVHRNNYQEYVGKRRIDPDRLPKRLRDSVKLGKIQVLMDTLRQEVRTGTIILGRKETLIDKLVSLKRITKKEKKRYEKAYAISEASFEVAMQMQGVTHETTIRGGAVYFIERNKYVREYLKFRQKNHKDQKAEDPDISEWSLEKRKTTFTRDQHIGWILDGISKGKRRDTFSPEEQALYNGLSPEDRERIVDQIPAHLAQKTVMAVVNWTRMKYRDDSPIWDEPDFKKRLDEKDDEGKHGNFRARYRSAMVQKALERALDAVSEKGFAAKFSDADYAADYLDYFDKDGNLKPEKVEPQPLTLSQIKLKRPHVFGYTRNGQPIIVFGQDGRPVGLGESDFDELGKAIVYDKPGGKERQRVNLDSQIYKGEYVLTERNDGEGVVVGVFTEEVDLDFPTAADSYLALHTAHTYFAYQSNNTHTLLPDYVFDQARQIRDGLIRPEDADILAGLLLTLDPTLCRVKAFPGEQMTLEGIVFDAAVEESLLGWVNVRDAFKERFLPKDGNAEYMGTGYYTEDQGGEFRFALQIEALVAKMPKRWARRFTAALSAAPIHADTMAGNLGRKGVIGAVSMMDDKIHELTGQRIASQFAITKFINLMDSGTSLWFALIGGIDPKTGLHHEGLFMKPTNNAEKVLEIRQKLTDALQKPEGETEVFHILLDSFGRVWDTLKTIRTMYSDSRNAGGALDLRKTDVFLPDGRFNPAIALEKERNTGSSRHIARMFWNAYVDWLLDKGPGGGVQAYKGEAEIYKLLRQPYYYFVSEDGKWVKKFDGRDWAGWLFDKMAL